MREYGKKKIFCLIDAQLRSKANVAFFECWLESQGATPSQFWKILQFHLAVCCRAELAYAFNLVNLSVRGFRMSAFSSH